MARGQSEIAKQRDTEVDIESVVQEGFNSNSLTLAQLRKLYHDYGVPCRKQKKTSIVKQFNQQVMPHIRADVQRKLDDKQAQQGLPLGPIISYPPIASVGKKRAAAAAAAGPGKKAKLSKLVVEAKQSQKRPAPNAISRRQSKRNKKGIDTEHENLIELKRLAAPVKGARHVTFDIHHKTDAGPGYVFFHSPHPKTGGPFTFLSSSFRSDFKVERIAGNHIFTSMAQFLNFCKTKTFAIAREFHVQLPNNAEVSSYEMPQLVLAYDDPTEIATLVRTFVEAGKAKSEQWYKEWSGEWRRSVDLILRIGLQAKFDSDEGLRNNLLKTGDYILAEASEKDKSFGIGYAARFAYAKRDQWEDQGRNKLGEALMHTRKGYRDEGTDAAPFDRKHYDGLIEMFYEKALDNKIQKEKHKKKKQKQSMKKK